MAAATMANVLDGRVFGLSRLNAERRPGSGINDDIEDSLRMLAPTQKKLTSVESQRVMTVATETLKRLERAMALPYLAEEYNRFSVSLGYEIVELLMEYRELSDQYTSLCHLLEEEGTHPSDILSHTTSNVQIQHLEPLTITNAQKLAMTQSKLKNVTKNLLRLLSQSPATEGILNEFHTVRPTRVNHLISSLGKFNGVINEKLLTTSIDEKRKLDHVERTQERQIETESVIQQLEQDLAEAQAKRDKEIAEKENLKKQITNEIRTVDRLARETQRKIENDAARMEKEEKVRHETAKNSQTEELDTVKKKLQEAVATNRDIEQGLRKKAFKRETEVENWIQKYDHDMGELQDELETLQEEYTEETKQLKELDERLEVLTVEYDSVVKEREETRVKKEEAERKMVAMTRAAIMIQRVWKAYLERRGPRKKDKKKGKKGKGGKKGKKGKKK